jgi:speckle-type POZ protein
LYRFCPHLALVLVAGEMPTPTTVSTGALETEKGRHLFRIVGYSQLRGMGRLIKSGIFSVGQHRWVVALRPAPINNDLNAGNVHVALVLYGTSAGQVWASYELNLVDQRTGLSLSVHKEAPRKFGHKSHHDFKSKASINVKQRSVFESPNYLHNDCLTIECIVTVIHEQRRPETKRFPSIEVPPSDITEHFGKLLETKEGAALSNGSQVLKYRHLTSQSILASCWKQRREQMPLSNGSQVLKYRHLTSQSILASCWKQRREQMPLSAWAELNLQHTRWC